MLIHVPVCRPCICLSNYLLLNRRAEFNQTCYITTSYGKGVREQHFFLCVRRASICPSRLLLNHFAEFNQTCYITSPHGKANIIFPFVRLPSVHLFVTLSPPKPLGGIQQNLLHHFPS